MTYAPKFRVGQSLCLIDGWERIYPQIPAGWSGAVVLASRSPVDFQWWYTLENFKHPIPSDGVLSFQNFVRLPEAVLGVPRSPAQAIVVSRLLPRFLHDTALPYRPWIGESGAHETGAGFGGIQWADIKFESPYLSESSESDEL